MQEVTLLRLYLLRAMYLLISVGLGITLWPALIASAGTTAAAGSVVKAMLGALSLLCLLGLRYPLRMLPLLLFELAWKLLWVLAYGLPLMLAGNLDDNGQETLFACALGVGLVPLVMPWRHVYRHCSHARGDAWKTNAWRRSMLTARTGSSWNPVPADERGEIPHAQDPAVRKA